jgi:hypothetical protein
MPALTTSEAARILAPLEKARAVAEEIENAKPDGDMYLAQLVNDITELIAQVRGYQPTAS